MKLCCSLKPKSSKRKHKDENKIYLSKIKFSGFKNIGNSCYMNSVLHCLFSMKVIRSILSEANLSHKTPLIFTLQKLQNAFDKQKKSKVYIPFLKMIQKVKDYNLVL